MKEKEKKRKKVKGKLFLQETTRLNQTFSNHKNTDNERLSFKDM